jgi:hypothetical protein
MRAFVLLLALPTFAIAAEKAVVLDATWDRFNQHTDLRYTHLGTQSRIESTAADKPDPYLLVDTAQDQRITVYRHNSSWRLDPLEPKPRNDSPAGAPGLPAMPQPPPGIGPQGPIGPRTGPGATATAQPGVPAAPPRPEMPALPQAPTGGYGSGATMPAMPGIPPGVGPQNGAMPAMPGAGSTMGAGFGGGMPMPPPSAMSGREQPLALVKSEETQTLLGRTAVKYLLTGRMMETIEIWAVPDADLGAFFAFRPQPPHRFGPIDLQDQWDSLLRREHLFPLLAIFRQGDREVARFTVSKIDQGEVAEPATFFAPPEKFYRCPPDPF